MQHWILFRLVLGLAEITASIIIYIFRQQEYSVRSLFPTSEVMTSISKSLESRHSASITTKQAKYETNETVCAKPKRRRLVS